MNEYEQKPFNSAEHLNACHNIVLGFVKQWLVQPTRWAQEIDVQVELASRLNHYFQFCNLETLMAKHSQHPKFARPYGRVSCEPYVILKNEPCLHPDIVVWGDKRDIESAYINEQAWPIAMIMEIKYKNSIEECGTEDIRRLKAMEKYEDHCCWRVWLRLTYTNESTKIIEKSDNGVTIIDGIARHPKRNFIALT